MKLLAFSDLHCDLDRAAELAERADEADVVIAAGDFAKIHDGLEPTIDALKPISVPVLLVPGNNETDDALRAACEGWEGATVLHGEGVAVNGEQFYGLGAGVPVTPWDWSFDLDEEQAAAKLADCPEDAVLVVHSPPKGHCDTSSAGDHLGSQAILDAIEAKRPKLAVCGHIHEAWGAEDRVGPTTIINLGPSGQLIDL